MFAAVGDGPLPWRAELHYPPGRGGPFRRPCARCLPRGTGRSADGGGPRHAGAWSASCRCLVRVMPVPGPRHAGAWSASCRCLVHRSTKRRSPRPRSPSRWRLARDSVRRWTEIRRSFSSFVDRSMGVPPSEPDATVRGSSSRDRSWFRAPAGDHHPRHARVSIARRVRSPDTVGGCPLA